MKDLLSAAIKADELFDRAKSLPGNNEHLIDEAEGLINMKVSFSEGDFCPYIGDHQIREIIADGLNTEQLFNTDGAYWGEAPPGTIPKKTVPLLGAIAAGGHLHPVDDHAKGGGLEDVDAPPGARPGTVAAIVQGTSFYPFLKEGSLIFWSRRETNFLDHLHDLIVCHLADGRKAIKILTPGTEPGRFTLTSPSAPPIENVELESVSPIDWMQPR